MLTEKGRMQKDITQQQMQLTLILKVIIQKLLNQLRTQKVIAPRQKEKVLTQRVKVQ